jgi:putative oxidoreductase
MSISEQISPLVGRCALAWFFLSAAYFIVQRWESTIAMLAHNGIPVAPLLLAGALLVMALGGISLVLGFHTRHGAMILFAFTIIVTALLHPYWRISAAGARLADYEVFARNIAIAGGLLLLVGMGPGPFALDNRGAKKGD